MRLGAYQLLFLDKIPPSAAVNSSVALVKQVSKNARAAGMVNGILRSLERSRGHLPDIPQTIQQKLILLDPEAKLSCQRPFPGVQAGGGKLLLSRWNGPESIKIW